MKIKVKAYTDKPVSERDIASLLSQEFDKDEVTMKKIGTDPNGADYVELEVAKDVPLGYLKAIGDKNVYFTSVIEI